MRDVDAKHLDVFLLDSQPVHIGHFVPGFQSDNQIHSFLLADASDAEHGGDVDDADSAHLHVVAGQFGGCAHEFAAIHEHDLGRIVRHEAVTALDQRQHALALANTALAPKDHADTENIHHAPHLG